MKAKHILLTLFAACTFSVASYAQTARQVLDQTASKLSKSGGVEATFEATQFKNQKETGSANGSLQLQGSKFKISSSGATTWFDGKNQWTWMAGSDEVNVSTPTKAELQQINPYTFIGLYRQGYDLKLASVNYGGKSCHEVRMIAQNHQNPIQLVIAVIDKQTGMPLSIRMKDSHSDWTRIRVNAIKTGKKWNDNNFRFDKKAHPGIDIIDLR